MKVADKLHQALNGFAKDFKQADNSVEQLKQINEQVIKKLKGLKLETHGLTKNNPLVAYAQATREEILNAIKSWQKTTNTGLDEVIKLSNRFDNRIILLVFGKVNAGKSSFSNFFAQLFDEEIKYFYLSNGEVNYQQEKFAEGVTETTARIQGIELGSHLVLLDSPGLHSVTDENGDLTRSYTDSADLVLWLTPSGSPGQTQELDDLEQEIRKQKPLLPVITRSDINEETIVNGDIQRQFFNKTPEDRNAQEKDVYERSKEYLSNKTPKLEQNLQKPVSISVHYCKEHQDSPSAWQESGLSRVIDGITNTIEQAREYKSKKPKIQLLNYLQYQVLDRLEKKINPNIQALKNSASEQKKEQKQLEDELFKDLIYQLETQVSDWAQEFAAQKDTKGLVAKVNGFIQTELEAALTEEIKKFTDTITPVIASLNSNNLGEYQDETITYTQTTGTEYVSGGSAIGGLLGGIVGFVVGGPAGAAVGAAAGSGVGNAVGRQFKEHKQITEVIGVSSEQVTANLLKQINESLPSIIQSNFKDWQNILNGIEQYCIAFKKTVNKLKKDIENQKNLLEKEPSNANNN